MDKKYRSKRHRYLLIDSVLMSSLQGAKPWRSWLSHVVMAWLWQSHLQWPCHGQLIAKAWPKMAMNMINEGAITSLWLSEAATTADWGAPALGVILMEFDQILVQSGRIRVTCEPIWVPKYVVLGQQYKSMKPSVWCSYGLVASISFSVRVPSEP